VLDDPVPTIWVAQMLIGHDSPPITATRTVVSPETAFTQPPLLLWPGCGTS
jgi:hypothetical protein